MYRYKVHFPPTLFLPSLSPSGYSSMFTCNTWFTYLPSLSPSIPPSLPLTLPPSLPPSFPPLLMACTQESSMDWEEMEEALLIVKQRKEKGAPAADLFGFLNKYGQEGKCKGPQHGMQTS